MSSILPRIMRFFCSFDAWLGRGIDFSVEHQLGSGPFYLFIGADADYGSAWYEALYVSGSDGA
jgi:hypothetical protein